MNLKSITSRLKKVTVHRWLIAAHVLVVVVIALFVAKALHAPAVTTESTVATPSEEPQTALAFPPSNPTRLLIPNLKLNTSFVEPLGLLPNGEAAVPDSYGEVGWYKYSPTPGSLGPSVIFGHVDSYNGPAVFFSLGQLKVGDDIYIEREDRTTVHFKVESLERPKQSEFPTARVYGDINYAGLRLITCTGIYVRGTQRYTHNLIVYARLVE